MTRITFAQGFFRLWVVISGLWLCGVALFAYEGISNPYYSGHVVAVGKTKEYFFRRYSTEAYNVENAAKQKTMKEHHLAEVPQTSIYMDVDLQEDEVRQRLDRVAAKVAALRNASYRATRHETLNTALTSAIAPPLVLLGIGLAIRWIVRGFTNGETSRSS